MRHHLAPALITVGALALTASSASAAIRHAAPGGSGAAPCALSAPCSFDEAVNGGGVAAGDTISLASGTYALASATPSYVMTPGIEIAGPAGNQPPAEIELTGGGYLLVTAASLRLRDVTVRTQDSDSFAINLQQPGAQLDRVRVHALGTSYGGLSVSTGSVVRDTEIWSPDIGIAFRASAGQTAPIDLINVTAVSRRLPVMANGAYVAATGAVRARLTNTLLHRYAPVAGSVDLGMVRNAGHGVVELDAVASVIGSANVDGTAVYRPGAGMLSSALLLDPAGRDLRQAAGSPTIDAGTAAAPMALGPFDVAGRPRVLGPAVDVGAHEHGVIPGGDPGGGGGGGETGGPGAGGGGGGGGVITAPRPRTVPPAPVTPRLRSLRARKRTLSVHVSTAGRLTFRIDRCRTQRTRQKSGRIKRREVCRRAATLRTTVRKAGTASRTVPRRLRAGRYRVTAHLKATSGNQATSVRTLRIARAKR